MSQVYEKCPVLENENFMLRMVSIEDAENLLKVYGDETAIPYFNSDNCNGDDFHYTTLARMQDAVKYWIWEYDRKGFVRWSIVDKSSNEAIGTIELFNRDSKDYFNECGLLRLDIRSDYEKHNCIFEILSNLILLAYELFDCNMIATKAEPFATERIRALKDFNFIQTAETLVGHDGTKYDNYWVRRK